MSDQHDAEPTVKLNVGMQVGYIANSTREVEVDTEIPRSKWDAMTQEERDKICEEFCDGEIGEQVSAWAEPIED
jgi:hypothetical protein